MWELCGRYKIRNSTLKMLFLGPYRSIWYPLYHYSEFVGDVGDETDTLVLKERIANIMVW